MYLSRISLFCFFCVIFLFGSCSKNNSQRESVVFNRVANDSCLASNFSGNQDVVQLEEIIPQPGDNLGTITGFYQSPGDLDHWYFLEQEGTIYRSSIVDNQLQSLEVFLNIKPLVDLVSAEAGLIGLAFHPDFQINNRLFVYYTRTLDPGETCNRDTLSEFLYDPVTETVDLSSETILLQQQENCFYHRGGQLAFGPDGYLYIGVGDQYMQWEALNNNTYNGTILRIDVDAGGGGYGIPGDNPLVGGEGREEIYAWGIRNPYKFSFDLEERLWLADVGDGGWEEVNIVEKGMSHGWPILEGFECNSIPVCSIEGTTAPIAVYSHDEGCAIVGGYVYYGSEIPELWGHYIYGDYCSGNIWSLKLEDDGSTNIKLLMSSGLPITSFAQDSNGEIYLGTFNGKIFTLKAVLNPIEQNLIPSQLTETGCFDSQDPKISLESLVPYDVNIPLWSDGAEKSRWFAIPDNSQIEIDEEGNWLFPVGSILIKLFKLEGRNIETRFLVQEAEQVWRGYSYKWNEAQTEAYLVNPSGEYASITEGRTWYYPGRTQCLRCHTSAASYVLGLKTRQMNRLFQYSVGLGNQISSLYQSGYLTLSESIGIDNLPAFPHYGEEIVSGSDLNEMARAYLDVNCSMCHRPSGPGIGPEDFRYEVPFDQMGACNIEPTVSNLGIEGALLITPGSPELSILLNRMERLDNHRMPPLGSSLVDVFGVGLISDWIADIQQCY